MTSQAEDYKKVIRARLDAILNARNGAEGTPSRP
jgi:predicted component of type VI protein secretion system